MMLLVPVMHFFYVIMHYTAVNTFSVTKSALYELLLAFCIIIEFFLAKSWKCDMI